MLMRRNELDNFIKGFYQQAVQDDFESDEHIWATYSKSISNEKRNEIIIEIENLIENQEHILMDGINNSYGGLSFESESDFYDFNKKFRDYLLTKDNRQFSFL